MTAQEAVQKMKDSEDLTVSAELVATALKMNPGVLRKRVQDGNYLLSLYDYNRETGRIRFFRKSFLQAIGEMEPEAPQRTTDDLLMELIEVVRVQNTMIMELVANTKTASCCNS